MQYINIHKFIRKKREAAKVSLSNFAYKNGLRTSTLSRIELGQTEVKLGALVKIAAGFNQTPVEFLAEFEKYKF